MSLFSPIWTTADPKKLNKAMAYVDKTDDLHKLVRIEQDARLSAIKDAARDKLIKASSNPKDLRYILTNSQSNDVIISILSRIDNQDLLISLYNDNRPYSVYIIPYINDQEVLKDIVMGEKIDYDKALDKLSDQEFLKEVACNHNSIRIREKAIGKINDEDFLKDIVNKNECGSSIAIGGIADQEFLKKIACDVHHPMMFYAFERITDKQTVNTILTDYCKRLDGLLDQNTEPKLCYRQEFRILDQMLCSKVSSSRLMFYSPRSRSELVYVEYTSRDTSGTRAYFEDSLYHSKKNIQILTYPDAMVRITDKPESGDELLICPSCSGVRKGDTDYLKKCRCNSKLNAVRLIYRDTRAYKRNTQ